MTEDTKKKKYKLFNASDDRPNSLKPCAFFFSAAGCRNANNCTFSHSASQEQTAAPAPTPAPIKTYIPTMAPVSAPVSAPEPAPANKTDKKTRSEKKVASVAASADPVASTSAVAALEQMQQMQAKMEELRKQIAQAHAVSAPVLVPVPAGVTVVEEKQNKKRGGDAPRDTRASKQQRQQPLLASSVPIPASNFLSPDKLPVAVASPSETLLPANFSASAAPTASVPVIGRDSTVVAQAKSKAPAKTPAKTPRTKMREEKAKEDDEDSAFLFGAVNTVLKVGTPNQMPTPTPVDKATGFSQSPHTHLMRSTIDFNNLPTTIVTGAASQNKAGGASGAQVDKPKKFSNVLLMSSSADFPFVEATEVMQMLGTSGTDHATKGSAGGKSKKSDDARAATILRRIETTNLLTLPWGSHVAKTHAHPKFQSDYSWSLDDLWVRARPYGEWCQKLPLVLAIDCEFCASIDPKTGIKDGCHLIRFSVVNGMNPSEVLIDELVQPRFPIVECRTHIHGITEADLKNVTFTLRDAQAALLALCSDQTIIVGHSVHNDLKSLHFYHTKVIDTAYLYTVENEPGASPSMRDVSQHILGTTLPEVHNSVLDARCALQATIYLLVFGDATPCPRTSALAAAHSLLVHRLPEGCSDEDIYKMIARYTNVLPSDIAGLVGKGDTEGAENGTGGGRDKVNVIFSSVSHAELAFDSIPGPNRPDMSGRAQKRVYYKQSGNKSGYICIRKNVVTSL